MNTRIGLLLLAVAGVILAGCTGVPPAETNTSPPGTSLPPTTPLATASSFTTLPTSPPTTIPRSTIPVRTNVPAPTTTPAGPWHYVLNLFHTTDRGDIYIDATHYDGYSERSTKTFDVLKVGEDFVPRSLFNPQEGIYWTFGGSGVYPKVTSLFIGWSQSGENVTYQKLYEILWNDHIDQQKDFLDYAKLISSHDQYQLTAAYATRLQSDAVKAGIACAQVSVRWTVAKTP